MFCFSSFVSNLTLDQVQFIATQSSYLTQSDGFDTTWPVPRFAQWFADLGLTLDPMQHRVYGTLFEEAIDWTFAWAQQVIIHILLFVSFIFIFIFQFLIFFIFNYFHFEIIFYYFSQGFFID